MSEVIRIGVIGYGYWGPNIVRNFNAVENAQVMIIADAADKAFKRATKENPQVLVHEDI